MSRSCVACAALMVLLCSISAAQTPDASTTAEDLVQEFFRAARSGDDEALIQSARAISQAGEVAVDLLGAELARRKTAEIIPALRLIRESKGHIAESEMAVLCKHESPEIRAETLLLCGAAGGVLAISRLHDGFDDPHLHVRRRAVDGLRACKAHDARTLGVAIRGLLDEDFWISNQSGRILGAWPPAKSGADSLSRALGKIIPKLNATSAPLAFSILARRLGSGAAPHLKTALRHKTEAVVVAAIHAATELKLKTLAIDMRRFLRGRGDATMAAVQGVGRLKDMDSVPELVTLLAARTKPSLKSAVAVSLRSITGQFHGYDVASWERYVAEELSSRRESRGN